MAHFLKETAFVRRRGGRRLPATHFLIQFASAASSAAEDLINFILGKEHDVGVWVMPMRDLCGALLSKNVLHLRDHKLTLPRYTLVFDLKD